MKSFQLSGYTVACSIGKSDFTAHVVIDSKNNSVHVHLYGEMFGNKRKPIQVKNSDLTYKDGEEEQLITRILADHFSGDQLQVTHIEKAKEQQQLKAQGHPLRIIARLSDKR